jgi:hypothetical protein
MTTFLMTVGKELCAVVWAKAERGEDDRFKADDLPIIFAAACAEAIRRSPDRTKAVNGAVEVLDGMLRAHKAASPHLPVQ